MAAIDFLVVGAGHNGLVCAARLGAAGYSVTLVERSARLGGAVETLRFPCGCYVNRGPNAYGMLADEVRQFLSEISFEPMTLPAIPDLVLIQGDNPSFAPAELTEANAGDVGLSKREVGRYIRFQSDLAEAVNATRSIWSVERPAVADLRKRLRSLRSPLAELIADGSIRDLCSRYQLGDRLAAAVAAGAILFPARTSEGGTALPLLYLGLSNVADASWGAVLGGYDVLITALTQACHKVGVRTLSNTAVTSIVPRLSGIAATLSSGESVHARLAIAAIDPWQTKKLVDSNEPPADSELSAPIHDGGCAKVNLLVHRTTDDSLPPMSVKLPSLAFLDAAYDTYMATGVSDDPYLEVSNTAAVDPTASCGDHIPVSVFVLFARCHRSDAASDQQR